MNRRGFFGLLAGAVVAPYLPKPAAKPFLSPAAIERLRELAGPGLYPPSWDVRQSIQEAIAICPKQPWFREGDLVTIQGRGMFTIGPSVTST